MQDDFKPRKVIDWDYIICELKKKLNEGNAPSLYLGKIHEYLPSGKSNIYPYNDMTNEEIFMDSIWEEELLNESIEHGVFFEYGIENPLDFFVTMKDKHDCYCFGNKCQYMQGSIIKECILLNKKLMHLNCIRRFTNVEDDMACPFFRSAE